MRRCATRARSSAITTCPPRSYGCGVTKGSRPGSNPALEPRRTQKGESLSSADLKAASPDMALVSAIRAGDQGAMAALYDRYSSIVYSVALRVLSDTGAAEDVLQDVFLQLWRNPGSFDSSRGSLGAWLAVITRHRAIDQLRRRRPESDIEDVIVAVDTRLEQTTDRNMAIAKIRAVVERLPVEQRKPLEMAFFEGLTHSEIASKTGEPLGTIKTRIRSALLTLRKALAA